MTIYTKDFSMPITKKVVFVAKETYIEELKALLTTMIEPSRAEKGCLLYNIYQITDKPTEFVVVETWETQAHLDAHGTTEHYAHYKENFEPFCAQKSKEDMQILG